MSFEILVGLNVLDNSKYDKYRNAMKPILADYEGRFGYDFLVSDVLISPNESDINRVFTINFSSKDKMESFFSDANYLVVKKTYFVDSIGSSTIISAYEKADI
jgi:uncharacterized protein (DUF1330 family)